MSNLKILMASSEAVPFAKTGGMADVVGALSQKLEKPDVDIKIFLPKYKIINTGTFNNIESKGTFKVLVGSSLEEGAIWTLKTSKNVEFVFIKNDKFYFRDGLYGTSDGDYSDNLERFVFYSKAVLEITKMINWQPDIIHCHDWQSALIPAYLRPI